MECSEEFSINEDGVASNAAFFVEFLIMPQRGPVR